MMAFLDFDLDEILDNAKKTIKRSVKYGVVFVGSIIIAGIIISFIKH